MTSSPLAEAAHANIDSVTANHTNQAHEAHVQPRSLPTARGNAMPSQQRARTSPSRDEPPKKEYVSKIGILTTSLPMYHDQIMKAKKDDEKRKFAAGQGEPLEPREAELLSKMSLSVGDGQQTSEQQAETIRRLKPHSRSTVQIQSILSTASQNPEKAITPTAKPKSRTIKWQFGIRSKNEPIDAIKCLYKALKLMGDCQWHVAPPRSVSSNQVNGHAEGPYPVNVTGATHITLEDSNLSESPEKDRHPPPDHRRNHHSDFANDGPTSPRTTDSSIHPDDSDSENDEDVDVDNPPPDYFPKDPWCIHVRWEKKGMVPPGTINTNSAQSSRVDLSTSINLDDNTRRGSIPNISKLSSAGGSATSVVGSVGPLSSSSTLTHDYKDEACFVYLDLQIYVLEMETYLVDFKCAGYESIVGTKEVVNVKGETVNEFVGSGVRVAEKDVTSPQPFLDLANKLVIHLANRGG